MGLIEGFAACAVASPTTEGFESKKAAEAKATESLLVVILTITFYVAIVLLVAFVGSKLWNNYLVPAVSVAKKVDTIQVLGIYILVRLFLM